MAQPPASVVARVCITAGSDLTVNRWNFVAPYLLCCVEDAHTGAGILFKRTTSGTFSQLSRGGGSIDVKLLEAYGVPANVATSLESGLHT